MSSKIQGPVCDRLVIRGSILVPQALHVGSGEFSHKSDAGIRKDKDGRPYIPGSTLGGFCAPRQWTLHPTSLRIGRSP